MTPPACPRCAMGKGQVFSYTVRDLPNVPDGTTFWWDVDRAIACVQARAHEVLPVPADVVVKNTDDLCVGHLDHVDPAIPGIQVLLPESFDPDAYTCFAALIDGCHRAARCVRDGLPFTAYLLTPEEEAGCRLAKIPPTPTA